MNSSTENIVKGDKVHEGASATSIDILEPKIAKEKRCGEKLREILAGWLKFDKIFLYGIYGLLLAHFVWATHYYIKNNDEPLGFSACTGYGFLLILFCLAIFSVAYKSLLRPHLLPAVKAGVWNPTAERLSNIRYGSQMFFGAFFLAVAVFLGFDTADDRRRLVPLSGLGIFLLVGYALSKHHAQIPWRTIGWGIILQFVFGLLTIRWDIGRNIFRCIGDKVTIFLNYATDGAAFVYGDYLVKKELVFAFQALSTIFFLCFMINILYHYGIMQKVVLSIGSFLQWVMGTTICESVNCAANIFLGQTEAPLLLNPYLKDLTASEIHSVITSGFATVSGTVLAAYISFGASAAHLITSSVMSAPAALCFSKLMYPETEESKSTAKNIQVVEVKFDSVLDAACRGAQDATTLVLGIIANLVAFISFVAFVNGVLTWMGILVGFTDPDTHWTVDLIVGKIFVPVSYVMGVPWAECEDVGKLIGIKTMVNEFAAFRKMQEMSLTPKTKVLATYALSGFSNPCSVGIVISVLSTLMPGKRKVIIEVIYRAFVAGSLVCFMTACIAGLLITDHTVV